MFSKCLSISHHITASLSIASFCHNLFTSLNCLCFEPKISPYSPLVVLSPILIIYLFIALNWSDNAHIKLNISSESVSSLLAKSSSIPTHFSVLSNSSCHISRIFLSFFYLPPNNFV